MPLVILGNRYGGEFWQAVQALGSAYNGEGTQPIVEEYRHNAVAARPDSPTGMSQQAPPRANSAAPATRATNPVGVSSGEPTRSKTTANGAATNAAPVPDSIIAVTSSKAFIGETLLPEQQQCVLHRIAGKAHDACEWGR